MARVLLLMVLAAAAHTALAADDLKVSQLEQDVRDLQRQVQALSRQIEMQRAQPAPAQGTIRQQSTPASAATGTPVWVDAAKWSKLQPGMSELEVVTLLGPPTSMRPEEGQRLLMYALEIGASGFLSGSITLRDGRVVAITKPTLQ
jgi:outer membrane murein-binding lipoprotein Lpp